MSMKYWVGRKKKKKGGFANPGMVGYYSTYATIPVPLLSVFAVDPEQPDHVELPALLRQQ